MTGRFDVTARFDAIVVGGGVAGCVVAGRLRRRHERVLVIEAGRATAHEPVPSVDLFEAVNGRIHEGVPARRTSAQALTPYLTGAGLGGGSLVNGLLITDHQGGLDVATTRCEAPATPLEDLVGDGWAGLDAQFEPAMFLGTRPGLRPSLALLTRGCTVVTARVDRVQFAGSHACGVVVGDGEVFEAAEVVMCAGALESPRLLRRSGVEPARLGRDLHDHPSICLTVPGDFSAGVDRATSTRIGRSRSGHLLYTTYAGLRGRLLVTLLAGKSSGRLTDTHAELELLRNRGDLAALRRGLRPVLAESSRFDAFGADATPAAALAELSDGELDDWILRNEGGTYHATGTCAIGSVVGRRGEVIGYTGLRVIDASILPRSPVATPMAEVMRLAARLA